MGMAFFETFFSKKTAYNKKPMDRYPSIDVHLDGLDNNFYRVIFTEIVSEQGRYSFKQHKHLVPKDKLEKIVEEIINISLECDSSSIGRASGFQPEC